MLYSICQIGRNDRTPGNGLRSLAAIKAGRFALVDVGIALYHHLRCGDPLVVWHLDRLDRSMSHLIEKVGKLAARGVAFRSLTGPSALFGHRFTVTKI